MNIRKYVRRLSAKVFVIKIKNVYIVFFILGRMDDLICALTKTFNYFVGFECGVITMVNRDTLNDEYLDSEDEYD
jgi:hypothetical protein